MTCPIQEEQQLFCAYCRNVIIGTPSFHFAYPESPCCDRRCTIDYFIAYHEIQPDDPLAEYSRNGTSEDGDDSHL